MKKDSRRETLRKEVLLSSLNTRELTPSVVYVSMLQYFIQIGICGGKEMDNRFEFIEKKGLMEGTRIIVDKQTGVQYLLAHWTNIGGLTVLVDQDGKPLLDPRYAK